MRFRVPYIERFAKQPKHLLVVETDGFRLRAAVVSAAHEQIAVQHLVKSHNADPIAGLGEAIEKLGHKRLPRRAILLVPEAIPAIIELPVDPAAPPPDSQMQEMIHWELEAQIAQQIGTRPIGEILVGRGRLTYQQVGIICEELIRRKQQASAESVRRAGQPLRFGDVAVDLGFVTRQELDECLAIQEELRSTIGDQCICGWTAFADPKPQQSIEHRWFVCGVSNNLRERWHKAFANLSIDLVSIYPLMGCSTAAIGGELSNTAAVVLEVQAGLLAATHLDGDRVEDFRLLYTAGRIPSVEMLLKLVGSTAEGSVWLAGSDPHLPDLCRELATRLRQEVRFMPVEFQGHLDQSVKPESLANLVGACRHAFGLVGVHRATCVRGREPAEPLWRRPSLAATAATLLVALALGTAEIHQSVALTRARQRKDQAIDQLSVLEREAGQHQVDQKQVEQLTARLHELQEESAQLQRHLEFFETRVPARQRVIASLLDAITEAASGQVVVNRIEESNGPMIRIEGWAIGDVAAERFADSLSTALRPLGLVLAEPPILSEKQGRLGLPGYAIEVRFAAASSVAGPHLLTQLTETRP
jgi:hypothetical protein